MGMVFGTAEHKPGAPLAQALSAAEEQLKASR
jgi:hypothetical protein